MIAPLEPTAGENLECTIGQPGPKQIAIGPHLIGIPSDHVCKMVYYEGVPVAVIIPGVLPNMQFLAIAGLTQSDWKTAPALATRWRVSFVCGRVDWILSRSASKMPRGKNVWKIAVFQ